MNWNKEIIETAYQAFAEGNVPGVLEILDPAVRWTEAEGFPYGGTYTGPEAVLENVFMKFGTEWDGFAAEKTELVAEGDVVIGLGEYSGTYRETGKSFKAPFVHVWRFENGKVVEFHQHTDTALVQQVLT